jgi:tRNA (cmo5U34)-methyltransferase
LPTLPDSGFDHVAPFYDLLAKSVFGESLKNAQLYLLPFIPDKSRVLVIGGGSGWLLQQLILTGKSLDIVYLDASPRMLSLARAKHEKFTLVHACKVSFRLGTEAALKTPEQFDVVITPFLLDLFPEQRLHQLMMKLKSTLNPKGLWLFADFWPIQQQPRWWQKVLTWSMYTFFGVVSDVKAKKLPNYALHFKQLNLQEIASNSYFKGFVQAKVYKAV